MLASILGFAAPLGRPVGQVGPSDGKLHHGLRPMQSFQHCLMILPAALQASCSSIIQPSGLLGRPPRPPSHLPDHVVVLNSLSNPVRAPSDCLKCAGKEAVWVRLVCESLFAIPHVSNTLSVRRVRPRAPAARSTRLCLLACELRALGAARAQVVVQGRGVSFRVQRLCLCDRSNQPYWVSANVPCQWRKAVTSPTLSLLTHSAEIPCRKRSTILLFIGSKSGLLEARGMSLSARAKYATLLDVRLLCTCPHDVGNARIQGSDLDLGGW